MKKILNLLLICCIFFSNFVYAAPLKYDLKKETIKNLDTMEAARTKGDILESLLLSYARSPYLRDSFESSVQKFELDKLTEEQFNDPIVQAHYAASLGGLILAYGRNPSLLEQYVSYINKYNPYVKYKKIHYDSHDRLDYEKTFTKDNIINKFNFEYDEVLAAREKIIGDIAYAYSRNPSLKQQLVEFFTSIFGEKAPTNPSKTVLEGTVAGIAQAQRAISSNPSLICNTIGTSIPNGTDCSSNSENDVFGRLSSIKHIDKNVVYENSGLVLFYLLIACARNPSLSEHLIPTADFILKRNVKKEDMTIGYQSSYAFSVGGLILGYSRNPSMINELLELNNKYNPYLKFNGTNIDPGEVNLSGLIESKFDLKSQDILKNRETVIGMITLAYVRNPSLSKSFANIFENVFQKKVNVNINPTILSGTVTSAGISLFAYARNPSLRSSIMCSLEDVGSGLTCDELKSSSNLDWNGWPGGTSDNFQDVLSYYGYGGEIFGSITYYEVLFNPNNGEKEKIEKVQEGTTLENIYQPAKEGYNFIGWYVDGEKYDFSKPINSNLVFEAKYEKIENPNTNTENAMALFILGLSFLMVGISYTKIKELS